jgi:hypothetical protein
MEKEAFRTPESSRLIEVHTRDQGGKVEVKKVEVVEVDIDEEGKPFLVVKEGDQTFQCKFVDGMWIQKS